MFGSCLTVTTECFRDRHKHNGLYKDDEATCAADESSSLKRIISCVREFVSVCLCVLPTLTHIFIAAVVILKVCLYLDMEPRQEGTLLERAKKRERETREGESEVIMLSPEQTA